MIPYFARQKCLMNWGSKPYKPMGQVDLHEIVYRFMSTLCISDFMQFPTVSNRRKTGEKAIVSMPPLSAKQLPPSTAYPGFLEQQSPPRAELGFVIRLLKLRSRISDATVSVIHASRAVSSFFLSRPPLLPLPPQSIKWAGFGEGETCANRKPTSLHLKFNVSQLK